MASSHDGRAASVATVTGTVNAWGYNGWGQLGTGTTNSSSTPRAVPGVSGVSSIAAGGEHSLVLISDGSVRAWGSNAYGELGNGTNTNSSTPVAVTGLSGVSAVAAGGWHSLALKSDGTVWAWGKNTYGQLGDGSTADTSVPVKVNGLTQVTAVAAGDDHSIALKSDGTVWAWGWNGYGNLGNGTNTNSSTPVAVTGLSGMNAVAAGSYDSIALKSDGTVWSWGDNSYGELGNGSSSTSYTPVQVSSLRGVTAVAAGGIHNLALESDGTVRTWGDNNVGQLGNGTYTNDSTPVAASGLTGVTAVAAGGDTSIYGGGHSLALKADGTVWTWGYDSYDQAGRNSTTPVSVVGLGGISAVSAGADHNLSLSHGAQGPLVGGVVTPVQVPAGVSEAFPRGCKCQDHIGRYPISADSGTFWHTFNDIAIPGRGLSLQFSRTYSTVRAAATGLFGFGWTHSYNLSLSLDSQQNATVSQESGSQVTFVKTGTSYAPSAPRFVASLVHNGDGTWTFTREAREVITFSASGQLTQMKDLNGYATNLQYSAGQLATITDPAGRSLVVGWTGGHITSLTDANVTPHRTVSYRYNDGAGNLTDVTDVAGGTWHFTYDTGHRMLTMRDPRGNTVTTSYDVSTGRVTWQKDQLNRQTTFAYTGDSTSSAGGTTTVTDPKGNVTVETYQYGVLVQKIQGYGTPQAATWTYRYDPVSVGGTTTVDPNGHTTTMTYDSQGNLLSSTDALGRKTVTTYNALNEPLTTTDPKNVQASMVYDGAGNLQSTSRPLNATVTQSTVYIYTDAAHPGDVVSMTDPDGKTWTYAYDAFGNRTRSADPLGNATTATFNADGWKLKTVTPKGNVTGGSPTRYQTTYSYTPFGDVASVTDPLGHVTTSSYDSNRNLVTIHAPKGNVTQYTYDAANQQTEVIRADGTTVRTAYNADGTTAAQVDGKGNATTYGYDSLARVTSTSDPLGRTTTSTYDRAGNRLTLLDPQSQTTTNTYDAANQLVAIHYSDETTPNVTNIRYDADGQRIGMTDGTGTSTWAWDNLNRLINSSEAQGGGAVAVVWYGYDLKGQLTTLIYPGGNRVTRAYDPAGRLTTITDWLANTTKFGYDPNSNLISESLPTATAVLDTYAYDYGDRLLKTTDSKSGVSFATFTDTRDSNSLLASEASTGVPPPPSSNYTYTPLNQLHSAFGATYAYDAAGNITTGPSGAALTYDTAGEVKTSTLGTATTTFGYDLRGNRISQTPSSGSPANFTYDQASRLIAYGPSSTYAYNGDGLRMSKAITGVVEPFVWDVSEGLPMIIGDGTTKYVTGPGGLPLEQVSGTAVLYLHHDQLGSTRLMTDSTGAVQGTYTYEPYGSTVASTGADTNPFGFAGQYRDAESGMYYLRARYYDPTSGQFLSRDPLEKQTGSSYGYVSGNPLNGTDASGLGWCGIKDMQQGCSTLPPSYPGPTKQCLVIGNGSTDVVTVERQVSCDLLNADGKRGPSYFAIDPSGFGATPADQTCSFDPGSGLSHCTTKPSETETKIFLLTVSVVGEICLHAIGVAEPVEATVAVADAAFTVWDWFLH